VQRARDGTWDIMREKKESETEEPVRRLATSRENIERVQETQLTLSGEGSGERLAI